jgi:hypothetical protein
MAMSKWGKMKLQMKIHKKKLANDDVVVEEFGEEL